MIRAFLAAIALSLSSTPAQAAVDASLFGPQDNSASSGPSDAQNTDLLQPAGSSSNPLQTADSGGASQSGVQDQLQAPANSAELKVIFEGGEQNQPQSLEETSETSWTNLVLASLVAVTAGIGAVVLWRRRSRPEVVDEGAKEVVIEKPRKKPARKKRKSTKK